MEVFFMFSVIMLLCYGIRNLINSFPEKEADALYSMEGIS